MPQALLRHRQESGCTVRMWEQGNKVTIAFDKAPAVKAWLGACQARPAFRKMWETRDKEPA